MRLFFAILFLALLVRPDAAAQSTSPDSFAASPVVRERYHDSQTRVFAGVASPDLESRFFDDRAYYFNISHRGSNMSDSVGVAFGTAGELGVNIIPGEESGFPIPVLPYAQFGLELRANDFTAGASLGLSLVVVAGGHSGGVIPLPYAQLAAGYELPFWRTIALEGGLVFSFIPDMPVGYAGVRVSLD